MTLEQFQKYLPKDVTPQVWGNVAAFEVASSAFKNVAMGLYGVQKLPLMLMTATDQRSDDGHFRVWLVFGVPGENLFIAPYLRLKEGEGFPSLSTVIHETWNYERKIRTFFGIVPTGHPDERPIILHENWPKNQFPLRKDFDGGKRPPMAENPYPFQKLEGEGIYEIPVGPIHAGIIEPGHFRFSVAGESIMVLEAKLGYVHKGSEKLFETLPLGDKVRLSEKISGDSSFAHSLAFCQAAEQLAGIEVPKRARMLRVVFAEMERLANHCGDIGAIMTDAGYNFGGANGARLRERVMRLNEQASNSRFLRGINGIGGVAKNLDSHESENLSKELRSILKDFSEVLEIAENSATLMNRLEGTGRLTIEAAKEEGVVGMAARAIGIETDARFDYPYAYYKELDHLKEVTEMGGDVYARFRVRVREVHASANLIQRALREMPEGPIGPMAQDPLFKKNALAIGMVEGWRGEIVYFVATDSAGKISRVAPRDPSFLNWSAMGHAGPNNNIVPDFPLINKSFNLSYSGNDL